MNNEDKKLLTKYVLVALPFFAKFYIFKQIRKSAARRYEEGVVVVDVVELPAVEIES